MRDAPPFTPAGIVTLTTDFGTRDGYVGAMKGVLLRHASGLAIHDLAHEVTPQDVEHGAAVLRSACPCFPAGTVHVGVIDPGVGTGRAAVAIFAGGHAFVGPDNGLFALVAAALGGVDEARRIDRTGALAAVLPGVPSATFHGRDVFAPTAAVLASGHVAPADVGPLHEPTDLAAAEFQNLEGVVRGRITHVDRFGNAITDIPAARLVGCPATPYVVSVGDRELELVRTYAEVDEGAPCAVVSSDGFVEIAVRDGSAAATLGIRPYVEVRARRGPRGGPRPSSPSGSTGADRPSGRNRVT